MCKCNLGLCYASGIGGVKKDIDEAMKWVKKAAKQGNADAQDLLETFLEIDQ